MIDYKQETICVPIETKVREFDGKLWLGLNAVERGYSVVLGPDSETKRTLDITKPDIYITKDPGDGNFGFFEHLHAAGITICGLDTEGAVFESIDRFATNKTEFLDYIDAFYAWGEKPADAIRQHYDNPKNIHITGNPRFDLLQPRLRFIYQDRASSLNEQYGNYILINGNFTLPNPYSQKQITKSEEVYGSIEQTKRDYAGRIFHLFLEAIYHLHNEFPDTQIVIRPHPGENNITYEETFRGYDQVHIEDSGDVRDWIAGASVTIHHDCTTGIESALMGVPVVSYRPVQNEEYESRLPQVVSHEALSRDKLTEYIAECLENDDSYEMDDEQVRELKQYFYNVDRSAAELICDVIDSLDTNKQRNYESLKPSLVDSLKRRVKSSRLSDSAIATYDSVHRILGNDSIPRQRQYLNQKFPGLGRDEIADSIRQMKPLLDIDDISVEKVPMTNGTYHLRSR